MKFLKEHCDLAWASAVTNCYKILNGLIDIEQFKAFISSFHNACEICFKQVMIDTLDYKVVDYGKMDPNYAKEYLNSNDLNTYFKNLDESKLSKLYSIEFNKIIEKFSKIKIKDQEFDIKSKLKLLQRKRNDETHFYINNDVNKFLNIKEFKELCILMSLLLPYFTFNSIISSIVNENPSNDSFGELNYFSIKKLNFISYDDYILNSFENNDILKIFDTYDENDKSKGMKVISFEKEQIFKISSSIYYRNYKNKDMSFLEFYRRFRILVNLNKIVINEFFEYTQVSDYDYEKDYYVIVTKTPKNN